MGFVPTMGGIHKGHLSLINKSNKLCKKTIVSIFINPKQFNNKKDFLTYPSNIKKDLSILKKIKGINFVYIPKFKDIYNSKRVSRIKINTLNRILDNLYLVPSNKTRKADTVPYSGLTGTVPTWNQDTTGTSANATKLKTARTIGGVAFDGRANITPKSHMGSDSILRILPNDFPTGNLVYNVGIKGASLVNLNQKVQTVYLTTQIPIGTRISSIVPYGSGKGSIISLRGLNIDGSYNTSALVFEHEKSGFAGAQPPLAEGNEYTISGKSDTYNSKATNYLVVSLTLAPEGGTFTGLIMNFS